ncbi:MAG: hypothetical protein PHE89_04725 [Alphaproteobacteria bacterium]|nr:hypothetical protein [Alphaproteobacteria bacterium]
MINKILEFIEQAGIIAKETQDKIDLTESFNQKDEKISNVVTQADLDISELFQSFIKDNFSHLNYIIIDEEKLSDLGDNPLDKVATAEYAFVLDPIDGTLPFSLKMPEYGISVGVLKFGKPYLGAVYCPAINEVVYFDGKNSYWLQKAFSKEESRIQLHKTKMNARAVIFDSPWNVGINDHTDFSKDTVMSLYSIVTHMLYIATGRGKANYFGVYPWGYCWRLDNH